MGQTDGLCEPKPRRLCALLSVNWGGGGKARQDGDALIPSDTGHKGLKTGVTSCAPANLRLALPNAKGGVRGWKTTVTRTCGRAILHIQML